MNSKTQNSSKLLLKVPTNISVPVATLHCYAAYLWFKKFDRFGVINPSKLPKQYRNRTNYWLKRLLSVGFIERQGDCYTLKAYQAVWRLMGIKKCKTKSDHFKFKYWKLVIDNDKSFLAQVKDGVFKHLARRIKNQIAFRLVNGRTSKIKGIRRNHVELSGNTTAKLFGYAYWTSGVKYRNKYFKVIKGERYSFFDHNGVVCTRYECGKVSLF